MEIIDVLGKPCPKPVIEAKKAIKNMNGKKGSIKVLVDNDIARQNLEKMAEGMGLSISHENIEDGNIAVTIEVTDIKEEKADEVSRKNSGKLVAAIGSKFMGSGSEDLGKMLMKSFIFSLTELSNPPDTIVFFNSGAYLTNEDSAALDDLRTLEKMGTKIITCGTCINFYGLKLAIGEVANMYEIAEILANSGNIINLS